MLKTILLSAVFFAIIGCGVTRSEAPAVKVAPVVEESEKIGDIADLKPKREGKRYTIVVDTEFPAPYANALRDITHRSVCLGVIHELGPKACSSTGTSKVFYRFEDEGRITMKAVYMLPEGVGPKK